MKKLFLCTLATLPLLAAPVIVEANHCPYSKGNYYSFDNVFQNRGPISSNMHYDDVMSWCSNWITELQQARWSAGLEASTGNLEGATSMLKEILEQKVGEIGSVFPTPPPHTADATIVAANIVNEVFAGSANLPHRLKVQVRYLMTDAVFGLIESAFEDLDQRYYNAVFNNCHGRRHCVRDFPEMHFLPRNYFDGMRQLAMKVLELQSSLDELQASDSLELGVSYAVAVGAKDILMNSVARRSLACEANLLDFTAKQIEKFLSCDGSSLDRRAQIRTVRQLLAKAKNDLQNVQCSTTRRHHD